MNEHFSHLDLPSAVLLASVALLVLLVLGTEVLVSVRARRLSRTDPPSEEKLEEVEEMLQQVGTLRLTRRVSAPSRHFEGDAGQVQGRSEDRGRGAYRPTFVRGWRDRDGLV